MITHKIVLPVLCNVESSEKLHPLLQHPEPLSFVTNTIKSYKISIVALSKVEYVSLKSEILNSSHPHTNLTSYHRP